MLHPSGFPVSQPAHLGLKICLLNSHLQAQNYWQAKANLLG